MQKYGPTLLTTNVCTREDLNKLVICVDELPDPSTVVEGSVMLLMKPQKGYCSTHFYRCEKKDSSTQMWWVDLDEYGSSEHDRKDSEHDLHVAYDWQTSVQGEIWYTGYLTLWWKPLTTDDSKAGPLLYDVVVRKLNDYPKSPDDGCVVVRSPKGTEYTEDKPYKYDDLLINDVSEKDIKIYYSLFHVYASGWWSRSTGPTYTWKV